MNNENKIYSFVGLLW